MKKYIFIFSVLILGSLPFFSHAATIVDYSTTPPASYTHDLYALNTSSTRNLGSFAEITIPSDINEITSGQFYLDVFDGSPNVQMVVFDTYPTSSTSITPIGGSDFKNITTGGWYTFTFSPAVAVAPNSIIYIAGADNGVGGTTAMATRGDALSGAYTGCVSYGSDPCNPMLKLYGDNLGAPAAVPPAISITSPTSTTAQDPIFWGVEANTSTSTYPSYVVVNYGASVALLSYTADRFPLGSNTFIGTSTATISFPKRTTLGFGTWYAQATLYDGNTGDVMATSSIISWTNSVPPVPPPFYATSSVSSTSVLFLLSTCEGGGIFSSSSISNITCQTLNGLKSLGNDIFSAMNNGFYTLQSLLQSTFPLNVFIHINSDFWTASIPPTSTPSVVLSSSSSDVFGGRSYTILDANTIPDISTNTGFDWRAFFSKIMYGAAGLMIILQLAKTIKHFRLVNSGSLYVGGNDDNSNDRERFWGRK